MRILFVCTGNIFRSLTAEYAAKTQFGAATRHVIGSAGIQALPQPIHPLVRERLLARGADASAHVQRQVTEALLVQSDLVVAMGLDHQEYVRWRFNRETVLFNEVCYQRREPVLDIHEALPDWAERMDQARAYALSVVDYIWDAMPAFLAGLGRLHPELSERGAGRSGPGRLA